MILFGFGVLVIGMIGFITMALSIPITLIIHYTWEVWRAPRKQKWNKTFGMFMVRAIIIHLIVGFILFSGISGHAGKGIDLYGIHVEWYVEQAWISLPISIGVIVLGQIGLYLRNKRN